MRDHRKTANFESGTGQTVQKCAVIRENIGKGPEWQDERPEEERGNYV